MEQEHKPLESNHFEICPHCQGRMLTEQQLEKVADSAAIKAAALMRAGFYQRVGASVVNRFFWIIGALVVGIVLFFNPQSLLK